MEFERRTEIRPAFDKRDPDPKKNYGIHGCELCFFLIKDNRAIQFIIYTDFHLSHVREEMREKPHWGSMGADVGYHSPEPMYDGQNAMGKDCHLIEGPCYYDGSSLQAEDMFNLLCEKGSDEVWKEMEKNWNDFFHPKEAP